MLNFIEQHYLALKVFHIVSFCAWMAGLFYLPRLFVYHVLYPQNYKMLEVMEYKLFNYIMQPASIATIISGCCLALLFDFKTSIWLHFKITAVLLLLIFHFYLNYLRKNLQNKTCIKSHKFFRIINEIPTILLIIIVFLAVVKLIN